jgi:hypothetical protein
MREYQMKKIIAVAVASAFAIPAFAADVTVSGDVEYFYKSTDAGASFDSGDQDVVVAGSEELSNGWTVTASLEMDGNEDGLVSDSSLTIDTGAVTVVVGDANDIAARMFDEKSDKAEQGGTGGEGGLATDPLHTLSLSISPMENLTVAYSKSTSNDDADATTVDINSYALQYSVMGVTLAYGSTEVEGFDEDVSTLSVGYATGPVSIGYDASSNEGNVDGDDSTNFGIAYNYGAGNIFVETGEQKDFSAGTKTETTAMGVSYAIGSLNTYALQNKVKESATSEDDQTIIGVEYKF